MRPPVASLPARSQLLEAPGRAWAAARALALRLEDVRVAYVVGALVGLQLLVALAVALATPHNAWLYFNGGDATEYWANAWALSHRLLPQTLIGYGVPVAYAWLPWLAGTTMLQGLPAIVVLQPLLLLPLVVACTYGIAARVAGRLFAAWATLFSIAAPVAALAYWRADYRPHYHDLFLPQLYGLVNMADFPSLVALVVGAYLVFRVVDEGRSTDAAIAGLVFGFAVGMKPSNSLVLPAVPLALLLARRWQATAWWLVALAPAIATLALWKYRGLGNLPLFAMSSTREALGTGWVGTKASHYLSFTWKQFHTNMADLREYGWSRALAEYLPLMGGLAALRKSFPKGLYLLWWFAVFLVVKGGNSQASLASTSYFRLAMPGFPAYLLLVACVALLVPGWGRRVASPRAPSTGLRPTRGLVAAVVLLAAVPLAVVSVAHAAPKETIERHQVAQTEAPISGRLAVRASPVPGGVRLAWRPYGAGASRVGFVVYRTDTGDGCTYPPSGAPECSFAMPIVGSTRATAFVDRPKPGTYVYRVGLAANPFTAQPAADVMLLSPPVTVAVRRG